MDLLNVAALDRLIRKNRGCQTWLANWRQTVILAEWRSLQDVRRVYPSADGVRLKGDVVVTVFNVKGNDYRLLTVVQYRRQAVLVLDVLTHAEYSRDTWKLKYQG